MNGKPELQGGADLQHRIPHNTIVAAFQEHTTFQRVSFCNKH